MFYYAVSALTALVLVPVLGQIQINAWCNLYQTLAIGQKYYIYNQEYYNNYVPNTRCRWTATAPVGYKIKLDCTDLSIPVSTNCAIERMVVSLTGNPAFLDGDNYCGTGTLTLTSTSTSMTIGLFSEANSKGGRMYCEIYAITSCECGVRNQPQGRIVGGTAAGVNEYPFMAALTNRQLSTQFCGATIIHLHYAITAAHCFDKITDANTVALMVGSRNYMGGTQYPLLYFTKHAGYVAATKQNDIAIVRTQADMIFSLTVSPVCLPFNWADNRPPVPGPVIVLGWGSIEFTGPSSSVLLAANVSTITNQLCQNEHINKNQIFPTQICTLTNGRDACQGDSGGPLLYIDNFSQRLVLVGVISYGIGCDMGFPAVNTRITSYMSWIITNTLDATYCVKT